MTTWVEKLTIRKRGAGRYDLFVTPVVGTTTAHYDLSMAELHHHVDLYDEELAPSSGPVPAPLRAHARI